ncbi:uncharacterized protein LOC127853861 [Dreissena polymorpha]|uniref:uncharacterized protein LOC127853861 n=1 Tax=Dreissena polymorpha TaxID=45954 RepID=UPI002263E1AA|nr:uncharacterized protein LOC127853861 [Dreissena polymorpha]
MMRKFTAILLLVLYMFQFCSSELPYDKLEIDSDYQPLYTDVASYDTDALETFRHVQKKSYSKYKRVVCRQWNSQCIAWTDQRDKRCCSGLSCRCNLWGQNCKCVSRLWG